MNNESNFTLIDESNFAAAYESCWLDLFNYCNRFVNDDEQSKEMIQDIFIYLWEKRNEIEIKNGFRNYLFGALKLKIISHYRKQGVRKMYVAYKQSSEQNLQHHLTADVVAFNELSLALNLAVDDLPARSRQVYKLSRESGLDNKTIASALMITEKAVEGNMTRALSFIRKKLKIFTD